MVQEYDCIPLRDLRPYTKNSKDSVIRIANSFNNGSRKKIVAQFHNNDSIKVLTDSFKNSAFNLMNNAGFFLSFSIKI